ITQRLAMALVVFLCSAFGANAWADPPGRVGRLGDMNGQVWLYTPDAGEWISAVRNRPLTSGDRIATDADGRAEVRIGSATVRLDGGTELEVVQIDDEHIALQLHNGSVAARLRSNDSAREFELRTAEGRFLANRPGRYRIDRTDSTSNLTVWSGEAVYEGPGSALTVYSGQRAEFWLDQNNAAQYSITDPVHDDFAAWSSDRDRRDDRSASTRYVSPEMTGVEDLDRYGRWEQAPEYGAVWVPVGVPVGWAPYSAGHWAWVSPWGWTWVDDAPWGFAPFHYGRWAMFHDRWCWVPGTYVRRPVYAPALVGWVGGPHFSLTVNVGGSPAPAVGWFPLAPREVYVPTYRVSPGYVQQVNITHVTNITNVTTIINNPQLAVTNVEYRNRHIPRAVTVVPQTVMVNRQPVAPSASQFRSSAIVQQIIKQPTPQVVAAAPTVKAPVITPAIAQARRMQIHAEPARPGTAAPNVAAPVAPLVVPRPPTRAAVVRPGEPSDARARAQEEQQRRREIREDQRPAGNVAAPPARAAAPAVTGAPAPAARTPVSPPARAQERAVERETSVPPPAVPAPPARPQPPARPSVVAPAAQTPPVPAAEPRARAHDVPPPPAARAHGEGVPVGVPQRAPQGEARPVPPQSHPQQPVPPQGQPQQQPHPQAAPAPRQRPEREPQQGPERRNESRAPVAQQHAQAAHEEHQARDERRADPHERRQPE
ncbi:MAG TPA: DUF6600 domain-containing protein, partial [Albitalea sp.]|nr:DUF6600 domain-containing protein [Albitalea sp.]